MWKRCDGDRQREADNEKDAYFSTAKVLDVDEMGLNTERDMLYDPSLDEKDEIWSSQQHCTNSVEDFM